MDYASAIEWLYGTQLFGIKLGLENVHRLCEKFDLPRGNVGLVHVAGTNGKGSVCAFVDSICRAEGYRTGLFTSPHLMIYRERIAVGGEWIGEKEVAAGLTELREAVREWDPHPTFFELSTVLAVRHFAERGVEIAVLETGMGGRLDATTAVAQRHFERGGKGVSVITPVSLDHQEWLGKSLAEIAVEKAGIIQPGVVVVSAPQEREAEDVLREAAARSEAPIRFVDGAWEGEAIGLAGRHQRRNAALAVAALEAAAIPVGEMALHKGIAEVKWRGRFHRVAGEDGAEIVIDGAHNPEAIAALVSTWREEYGSSKAAVIFGTVASKDFEEMLRRLEPIADDVVFCKVNSARGLGPEELASRAGRFADGRTVPGVVDALALCGRKGARRVLVTGSLFLAGEALAHFEDGGFERSAQ